MYFFNLVACSELHVTRICNQVFFSISRSAVVSHVREQIKRDGWNSVGLSLILLTTWFELTWHVLVETWTVTSPKWNGSVSLDLSGGKRTSIGKWREEEEVGLKEWWSQYCVWAAGGMKRELCANTAMYSLSLLISAYQYHTKPHRLLIKITQPLLRGATCQKREKGGKWILLWYTIQTRWPRHLALHVRVFCQFRHKRSANR